MAQKPWIVPIPGTTQMPHMIENIGAASVSFTPEEIGELNSAVAAIEVRGQRLPGQRSGVLERRSAGEELKEPLAMKHQDNSEVSKCPLSALAAWA